MLTGVHLLLTYKCDRACDHCFVFGSPEAGGTFTVAQLSQLLEEVRRLGTVETVFFEGGEPFLFYPILLEGVRLARGFGFDVGIVTNGYWGDSEQDATLWLQPLCELGLSKLCVSDDELHYPGGSESPAARAVAAARELGMTVSVLETPSPRVEADEQGLPVVVGGVMFRGRAAENLTEGLPRKPAEGFTACTAEQLGEPGRVHVDAYGNVHICQGLLMGNAWWTPFSELARSYEPEAHPIIGPLLEGGPLRLAQRYGIRHEAAYVDACHFCYEVRKTLREGFPQYLAPPRLYGL